MSQIASKTAEQLTEAFAEFEDASRTLGVFYRSLERQVAGLNAELSAARAAQARELEEKERLAGRLQSLLDALPGGVVVLDQFGRIQTANPVARELLGPLADGEAWSAVVARAFTPRWDDGHDISLSDGRRVNIATQALAGEPGQILLLNDVTETRGLQEQLAHHKRLSAKTEMAAAMAHQIRTPLASALLSTGNLTRARDDATRDRAARGTVRALRKLERLVDEMLLFARGGRFDMAPVTIPALAEALQAAVAEAFSYKDFSVEFAIDEVPGRIHANLAALSSITLNLIENAHQAAGGRGRMTVLGRTDESVLELRFIDDGPGIGGAERERIFEPFFTTRSNGTGLGLAVARGVAQAHGGDLELEPDADPTMTSNAVSGAPASRGTCFRLTLPLATARKVPQTRFQTTTEIAHAS